MRRFCEVQGHPGVAPQNAKRKNTNSPTATQAKLCMLQRSARRTRRMPARPRPPQGELRAPSPPQAELRARPSPPQAELSTCLSTPQAEFSRCLSPPQAELRARPSSPQAESSAHVSAHRTAGGSSAGVSARRRRAQHASARRRRAPSAPARCRRRSASTARPRRNSGRLGLSPTELRAPQPRRSRRATATCRSGADASWYAPAAGAALYGGQ